MCSLGRAPRPFPTAPPSPAGGCGAPYCLAIQTRLNGPKSTAHEYLKFACRLCPSNEDLNVVKKSWPILTIDRTIFEVRMNLRAYQHLGLAPFRQCGVRSD